MSASIKDAQLALDVLCSKVKLGRESLPVLELSIPLPAGACLWSGDYACVLLWPLFGQSLSGVKESVVLAQDYFDEILVAKESVSISCDGYLILALDSQPVGQMDEIVREFELSTSVCRKNTIWPSLGDVAAEPEWARIADVAVLGLPEVSLVSEERLSWPVVGDDVRRLWHEINSISQLNTGSGLEKYSER